MSFEIPGTGVCDGVPCRYGNSRLLVRGPHRPLDKPYVAFLGSSDTFGKFVKQPFPELMEQAIGSVCVNLGSVNAGVDAFVNDVEILRMGAAASVAVVQVMGAQNLSNRFYHVHPRRNDRFVMASTALRMIYRDVDFTEFHFNKHMLTTLQDRSRDRFAVVQAELESAWLSRMRLLLRHLGPKTVLLWLRHAGSGGRNCPAPLGTTPVMVSRAMLEQLAPDCGGVVEVPVTPAGLSGELPEMQFGPLQAPMAEQLIGPRTHARIAEQLAEVLRPML